MRREHERREYEMAVVEGRVTVASDEWRVEGERAFWCGGRHRSVFWEETSRETGEEHTNHVACVLPCLLLHITI